MTTLNEALRLLVAARIHAHHASEAYAKAREAANMASMECDNVADAENTARAEFERVMKLHVTAELCKP